MSNINTSIPTLSVEEAITNLEKIYIPLIKNNIPLDSVPSAYLWGPPGVGKSEAVIQLGERIEEETGKKVKVTDIRLILFSPIDLRGVPVADMTKTFTDWLKPRILDFDPSEDTINILFLDELSAAPQSVQAAAYQITLNHRIGEHKLSDNTIVIAAGNRTTDKSVAYHMPKALANRLLHFEIGIDPKEWIEWAIQNANIHPYVLGYLMFDSSKLLLEEVGMEDLAYPTPRSWVFVSNILNATGTDDIESLQALVAGCIGAGTAVEFLGYCKVYKELPKIEDILAGKLVTYPKSPDASYAIISSLTSYISRHAIGDMSYDEIDNLCSFCNDLQADYATCIYRNLSSVEGFRSKLAKSSAFMKWIKMNRNAVI